MKDFPLVVLVTVINCLMFFLIIRKLSFVIKKFDEYHQEQIVKEWEKFHKNQKSLNELKELFDMNKQNCANESKGMSTNNWQNTRKAFAPAMRLEANE